MFAPSTFGYDYGGQEQRRQQRQQGYGGADERGLRGFAPPGRAQRSPQLQPPRGKAALLDDGMESSDETEEELVLSNLHANVYAACFALTVRGLRDKRTTTLLVSWLWVLLSIAFNVFLLHMAYYYVAFKLGNRFSGRFAQKQVPHATAHLVEVINGNKTLDPDRDQYLVTLCSDLPSPWFFCLVEFLFNAYLMAQLSTTRTLLFQIWNCPVVRRRDDTAEERIENMVVSGLLSYDAYWLCCLLVFPKMMLIAILWYVGTAFIAFTTHISTMASRVLLLVCIAQVDVIIFESFFSSSKKDWVTKVQVAQYSKQCTRYATAWPGELAKLGFVTVLCGLAWELFSCEFDLRDLCWTCARTCTLQCSAAFTFCGPEDLGASWPWLHLMHNTDPNPTRSWNPTR
mmetsp:Transcript_95990/g.240594  ORF Transcript_95990/g.240594 Transcript_95990/m.240594 type:complete len:400 (-) Transcript_95990:46-1245(-)